MRGSIRGRDGFYVYAGRYRDVGVPAGARVHAHNHPGTEPSAKLGDGQSRTSDLDAPYEGKRFEDLIADPSNTRAAGLAPSIHDVHAISDGASHIIYTRFVHRGGFRIANPVPGDTAPRVALHLAGTKVVRFNRSQKSYWYQVSVQVKDAKGTVLWSGEMYGRWDASFPGGPMHFKRPPDLDPDRRLPPGWELVR